MKGRRTIEDNYKECEKCEGHSYLTLGKFYLCVICGHKDWLDINDRDFQSELEVFKCQH